jgi:hypothetical protein
MFDAWQAQQRAQKDQERKAKIEAASALQGYRRSGLSEEETKLAALREQERLQKLNAEQQLHGYRSQLTPGEAKLAAQRQEELRRKQAYEEELRNNGVVSSQDPAARQNSAMLMENSGLVSDLASQFSTPNKAEPPMPTATKEISKPDVPLDPSPVVAINGISPPEESIPLDSTPVEPTTTETIETVPTETPAQEAPEAPPAITEIVETVPAETPTQEAPQIAPVSTEAVETIPTSPATAAPPPPKLYKSSVKFMFGILTTGGAGITFPQNRNRLVEGYLARADLIAKSVIEDNNSSSSSFESISLSMAYPTASSVKKDECK